MGASQKPYNLACCVTDKEKVAVFPKYTVYSETYYGLRFTVHHGHQTSCSIHVVADQWTNKLINISVSMETSSPRTVLFRSTKALQSVKNERINYPLKIIRSVQSFPADLLLIVIFLSGFLLSKSVTMLNTRLWYI